MHITAKDLMEISVDQRNEIKLLCSPQDEIGQAMRRLSYNDDVDLFSMWACLLLCREVASSSVVVWTVVGGGR